jgi:hypothetical protein
MFKHCRSDYFPWTTFRRNISNKSNLDVARLNPEPPTGYEKPSVFLLDEAFVCTGRKTSTIIIIMAMREVIEKATRDRVVWLWEDFCKSLSRHLQANRSGGGGILKRSRLQQSAFCSGLQRICTDMERCCENVTIHPHVGRRRIALRLHRLKEVPLKDRHQNQLFVATIPEYEASVPVRATFVGEQDCHAHLPIVFAQAERGSANHYDELMPMADVEVVDVGSAY